MEQLFGGDKRIQAVMEHTGVQCAGSGTATSAGRIIGNKESLLRNVVERAKELGAWIPDIGSIVDRVIGNGQENDEFISVDGLNVIKLKNFALLSSEAVSLDGFVHRLKSHNALFPECAYTIIGFTSNGDNQPCAVLQQPYIKAERYAIDSEIDAFLESCGYSVDIDDIWFDGQFEISDVKSSNVLVDENGNLHFIDAVVNDISIKVDRINRISVKHPGKRLS